MIDPVWDLYARAIERCGPTPTLLEWDDHIPSFDEVHAEAKKANRYIDRYATTPNTVDVTGHDSEIEEGKLAGACPMNSEPMPLARLQREMARAVMMPLTRDEDNAPRTPARWSFHVSSRSRIHRTQ